MKMDMCTYVCCKARWPTSPLPSYQQKSSYATVLNAFVCMQKLEQ